MHNIAEYPSIIEEKADSRGNLPNDFENYCGKMKSHLYHQKRCGNNNGKNAWMNYIIIKDIIYMI